MLVDSGSREDLAFDDYDLIKESQKLLRFLDLA